MTASPGAPSPSVGERVTPATTALRRAVAQLERGERPAARRSVDEALGAGGDDPTLLAVAGVLRFAMREHHRGLELLERAAGQAASARAEWLVFERASRLGWELDAKFALSRAIAREPAEGGWLRAMRMLAARHGSLDAAARWGGRAVEVEPDSAENYLELAALDAARGDRNAVLRWVREAVARDSGAGVALEGARHLRDVGEFETAERSYRAALAADPQCVDAAVGLAELKLWSGDTAAAVALVERLEGGATDPRIQRILGVAARYAGRQGEARACFEAAVKGERPDSEAHAWLAEMAIGGGRLNDAHGHVTAAIEAAHGSTFAAHVLRLRINLEERRGEEFPFPHAAAHHLSAFRALVPDVEPRMAAIDDAGWRVLFDRALVAMHANRSGTPTYLADGALRKVPDVRDPRLTCRAVLNRVRFDDVGALLREFGRVGETFPHSALPAAHEGELLLWLGRVDEAEATLERAISVLRGTRWPYIGLGIVHVMRDDPAASQRVLARGIAAMNDTTGPAVFGVRGEALYLASRFEEAEADLRLAIEASPTRVSAHLVLALVHLARGDREAARRAARTVWMQAPGLFSDAAREASIPLDEESPVPADLEAVRTLLLHARRAMRGNRSSSCVTYFDSGGRMRFESRQPVDPDARLRDDLAFAGALLEHGLGALPAPRVPPTGARSSLADRARRFVTSG